MLPSPLFSTLPDLSRSPDLYLHTYTPPILPVRTRGWGPFATLCDVGWVVLHNASLAQGTLKKGVQKPLCARVCDSVCVCVNQHVAAVHTHMHMQVLRVQQQKPDELSRTVFFSDECRICVHASSVGHPVICSAPCYAQPTYPTPPSHLNLLLCGPTPWVLHPCFTGRDSNRISELPASMCCVAGLTRLVHL